MTNPKTHPFWPKFKDWAQENGVYLEKEEEWIEFWKCFIAGAQACAQLEAEARVKNA